MDFKGSEGAQMLQHTHESSVPGWINEIYLIERDRWNLLFLWFLYLLHRDRPSVNTILKKPFIQRRIEKFLSETVSCRALLQIVTVFKNHIVLIKKKQAKFMTFT